MALWMFYVCHSTYIYLLVKFANVAQSCRNVYKYNIFLSYVKLKFIKPPVQTGFSNIMKHHVHI